MDEPIPAVVAILREAGRFLFVKRSASEQAGRGFWSPVSGRIEPGESEEQTLRREAREEVGLEIEPVERLCTIPSYDGRYRLHFWTAEILRGEARIHSDEAAELRWLTLDELKRLEGVFEENLRILEALERR